VLQDAWTRGQQVSVHGWVYSLHDGRVRNLGMDVSSPDQLPGAYRTALARLSGRGADA
jgi:carbonic anhydrase